MMILWYRIETPQGVAGNRKISMEDNFMDYEEKILSRSEHNEENPPEVDYIEIREFNVSTGRYETVDELFGDSARRYMEINGIW
jgi:hypothetical protein